VAYINLLCTKDSAEFRNVQIGDGWLFGLLNDGRGERVFECDRYSGTLTNIVYQGWPETRDACTGFVPDTGINDAAGSRFKKLAGQLLRGGIAAWVQAIFKDAIISNVVKLPAEVSEEIDVSKNLVLLPLDFLQFLTLVVGHFDLRGLTGERCIPSAPFRPVETVSEGTGMRERSVDNVGVRKTENEFPNGNAGKKASFAEEAVVRGSFKLE